MTPYQFGITPPTSPLSDEQQLVFLHFPKTAGTSFLQLLEQLFPTRNRCPWYFMEKSPIKIEGYDLYVGHFYYQAIKKFVRPDAQFVTFLRHPIDRVISNYHHMYKDAKSNPHLYPNFPETLEKCLFDEIYRNGLIDLQTRLLAVPFTTSDPRELINDFEKANKLVASGHRYKAESVFSILESFSFVGLTERYDESLALLFYSLGLKPIFQTTQYNVGNYKTRAHDLSPEVITQLVELNLEDLRLYQYAQELFSRRFDAMLKKLTTQNYRLQQVLETQPESTTVVLHHTEQDIREIAPENRTAHLLIVEAPTQVIPYNDFTLKITVKNTSSQTWYNLNDEKGKNGVAVGYYWMREEIPIQDTEIHHMIPHPLPTNSQLTITLKTRSPALIGHYTLYLALLQEGVAWFTDSALKLPIEVSLKNN